MVFVIRNQRATTCWLWGTLWYQNDACNVTEPLPTLEPQSITQAGDGKQMDIPILILETHIFLFFVVCSPFWRGS